MAPAPDRSWRFVAAVLLVVACGVAVVVIQPLRSGQVGFDSAASVLYFERIVSGARLEEPITATPKPLLTVVFGLLHGLTGDWRALSLATIAVYAVAIALASGLAHRLAGRAAGVFAGVATLAAIPLLEDVALSYAIAWAAVGWLVAGLALTTRPARYGVAGIALCLATLARIETLILVGLAILALLALQLAPGRGAARPPRAAWLLVLGLLALPIQALHDVLLTGDPLYSRSIPALASAGATLIGPIGALEMLVGRYLVLGPLVLLAALGVVVLVRGGPAIALGLVGLTAGVAASIVLLAAGDTFVSARYLVPIDLALLFGAAVGFSALRIPSRPAWSRGGRAAGLALLAGAVVGLAVTATFEPLADRWFVTIRSNLRMHENADAALPFLREHAPPVDDGAPVVLVPVLLQPQTVVDLGVPIPGVGSTDGAGLDGSGEGFVAGQVIFHDRWGDRAYPELAALETDVPVTIGPFEFVPLASDPERGYWVLEVRPAGS